MRSSRLHLAAMSLFIVGFVLSGSGWAGLLERGLDQRPSWSLCGQQMCSCLPTPENEPLCPLCLDETTDKQDPCQPGDTKAPPPMPKRSQSSIIAEASQTGITCIFLTLLTGSRAGLAPIDLQPGAIRPREMSRPKTTPLEIPSPPPRC